MILIIDDCIETKIGIFKEWLERAGLQSKCAKTLEEATALFESNIDSIDAIILDYSFPVSEENTAVQSENKLPNGIVFLKKYEMKLQLKRIPLIINTDGDEEYRDKYLRSTRYFSNDADVLYKSPGKQPLSSITPVLATKIIQRN